MPVVLDGDTGERVLLYGSDGASLLKLAVDSSGRLITVGAAAGAHTPVDAHGHDGSAWQKLLATTAGLLRQTKHFTATVSQTYSGAPGAHGDTVRWTYTVPAATIAYLEATFIQLNGTGTNTNDYVVIDITRSGGAVIELLLWRRLPAAYQIDIRAWDIALAPGDRVRGRTGDNSGTTDFRVNAFLRQVTL